MVSCLYMETTIPLHIMSEKDHRDSLCALISISLSTLQRSEKLAVTIVTPEWGGQYYTLFAFPYSSETNRELYQNMLANDIVARFYKPMDPKTSNDPMKFFRDMPNLKLISLSRHPTHPFLEFHLAAFPTPEEHNDQYGQVETSNILAMMRDGFGLEDEFIARFNASIEGHDLQPIPTATLNPRTIVH